MTPPNRTKFGRMRLPRLLVIVSFLVLGGCKGVDLTKISAQKTVDRWGHQRGTGGTVAAEDLNIQGPDYARSNLNFKDWTYDWQGATKSFSGSGVAIFGAAGGKWTLQKVMVLDIDAKTRSFPEFEPKLALVGP